MTRRWTIVVIGCGNIGSRHLQGLARLDHPSDVFGIDPVEASRELSKQRVAEVNPGDHLSFGFYSSISSLPSRIDLAIIATAASVRPAVIQALLAVREVENLILEKFLFQRLADYDEIGDLFARHRVSAWVNTPRRAWPCYQSLRQRVAKAGPLTLSVETTSTNTLATNAIHLVDLLDFLADGQGGIQISGEGLSAWPEGSRHRGIIEFQGVMTATSNGGDQLIIRGLTGEKSAHPLVLVTAAEHIVLNESEQKVCFTSLDGSASEEAALPIVYQSALTGGLAHGILSAGRCSLPVYAVSAPLHRACLEAFLQALGERRDNRTYTCPVT